MTFNMHVSFQSVWANRLIQRELLIHRGMAELKACTLFTSSNA